MPHITVAVERAALSGAALSICDKFAAVLLCEAEGSVYYYFGSEDQYNLFNAAYKDHITYLDIIQP
jgi:lipid II:glycine glycyltransferase (peptidoglycan interpeptide bridge formation enzyme)